jgi:hypothetical protein
MYLVHAKYWCYDITQRLNEPSMPFPITTFSPIGYDQGHVAARWPQQITYQYCTTAILLKFPSKYD